MSDSLYKPIETTAFSWYNNIKKGGETVANDKHMTETLSNTLQNGETLMHPIFGTIKQGNLHSFAYFAFTEAHFLITYLTAGDKVTNIERIPLDIKSVKIKKSNFLSEYKIHILFGNKRTLEISTYQKILKIKSQKENLPRFLDYLKSRSKKQAKSLEEIDGKKIRWQYFNTLIYMILAFIPAVPAMIIMQELRKGNFDIWNIIVEMSGATPVLLAMYGIFIGPFAILSILNRALFGKILGVVTKDTLFLENREISIIDINKITYHPRIISRHNTGFSHATLFIRTKANNAEQYDVVHFPMYGLRIIKKRNKGIKLKCDRYIWFLILCPTVICAVIGFLLG